MFNVLKKIAKNTYDNFRKGYFKKLGQTSFFNFHELKKLFKNFNIIKLEKKMIKNERNIITKEFYNIECKKK